MVGTRHAFVEDLYQLGRNLGIEECASTARRELAHLRRGLHGDLRGLDRIFRNDPPAEEVSTWILVGGLYALYPKIPTGKGVGLGGALGQLKHSQSTEARLRQLVSVHPSRVGYHARQVVQLVSSHSDDVSLNFKWVLDDLVVLEKAKKQPRSEAAYQVRLRWAQEYSRAVYGQPKAAPDSMTDETEGETE